MEWRQRCWQALALNLLHLRALPIQTPPPSPLSLPPSPAKHRSGASKGTAHVVFESPADALRAFEKYNALALDGRKLQIELVETAVPPGTVKQLSSGINVQAVGGGHGGHGGAAAPVVVAMPPPAAAGGGYGRGGGHGGHHGGGGYGGGGGGYGGGGGGGNTRRGTRGGRGRSGGGSRGGGGGDYGDAMQE